MKLKQHLAKADTAEQYLQLLLRYLTEISSPIVDHLHVICIAKARILCIVDKEIN